MRPWVDLSGVYELCYAYLLRNSSRVCHTLTKFERDGGTLSPELVFYPANPGM